MEAADSGAAPPVLTQAPLRTALAEALEAAAAVSLEAAAATTVEVEVDLDTQEAPALEADKRATEVVVTVVA